MISGYLAYAALVVALSAWVVYELDCANHPIFMGEFLALLFVLALPGVNLAVILFVLSCKPFWTDHPWMKKHD